MPVLFSFDARADSYGRWTLSDRTKITVDVGSFFCDQEGFVGRLRLRSGVITAATAKTFVYQASGLRGFTAMEVVSYVPSGSVLRIRSWDGTARKYYSGGSWQTAGTDDWNTVAEFEANFTTFPVVGRKLGFEFKLQANSDGETPIVYGVKTILQISFWSISDEVMKIVIAALKANVTVSTVEKFTTKSTVSALDYSDGITPEYSGFVISGVDAVFNLTDDVDQASPLPGTWSSITKTFTLTTPVPSGKQILAHLRYAPAVAYVGNKDYFADTTPLIVFTTPSTDRQDSGEMIVRQKSANPPVAKVVHAGFKVRKSMTIRIISEDGADCESLSDAIDAWMPNGAVTLSCGHTGRNIVFGIAKNQEISKPGDAGDFLSEIHRLCYIDYETFQTVTAENAYLQKEGGFNFSVIEKDTTS